jgi:MFS superfamily sulfate permease-like transporter
MIVATAAIGLLGGEATGVHVAGQIPSGLPHLVIPNFDVAILRELVPGALAIVLVGYAESLGAAKAAAADSGGDIDPNQELIAHGPANILSGLFGGFLVVGSLSKTSVAIAAGARTQFANLVAAIFCLLTLVLLTPLFRNMPQPTLAAIVIAAMLHLTKPLYLRDLLLRSGWGFTTAMIVFLAELTLGVMHGIALGVVLSLLLLIYVASHPHSGVLGQLPGSEAYRDVRVHPEARIFPGLLIWRVGGDLFFASIGYMEAALKSSLAQAQPPVTHVLLDFSSVNYIDVSACDELIAFIKKLKNQRITVAFARVRDSVRHNMQLGKIETVASAVDFYERITDGVTAWQRRGPSQT